MRRVVDVTSQRERPRVRRALSVLAVLALMAAACSDESSQSTATVDTFGPLATESPERVELTGDASNCDNDDEALTDRSFVILEAPASGDRLESGFDVHGCSRTFESNVVWTLTSDDGAELASGFTMGGGVDGFADFNFQVDFDVDEVQLGSFVVEEPDPSDGEGGPPSRNEITVVLIPAP